MVTYEKHRCKICIENWLFYCVFKIALRRGHSVTEGTFDNLGDCSLMEKVNDRDFSVMKNILFVYIKKNLEEKILSIMCSCAILTGVTEGTKKGP